MARPLKYKTVPELEAAIDAYFQSCEGYFLTDEQGALVLDKRGAPIVIDAKPPTVTGLALALGFSSRQALMNYQGRKQFNDTITRAKSRCEAYAEGRLFDRDGTNGAQFSLRCNFGWNDKPEQLDAEQQKAASRLFDALEREEKP
ncbi:MAG: DNA-packaging protein [Clostridiales bacterium]|nr:DNA-packaging protein [Clostridiales bacterium]